MLLALWTWRTGEWTPPYVPLLHVYTTDNAQVIEKRQKTKPKVNDDEALLIIFGAI